MAQVSYSPGALGGPPEHRGQVEGEIAFAPARYIVKCARGHKFVVDCKKLWRWQDNRFWRADMHPVPSDATQEPKTWRGYFQLALVRCATCGSGPSDVREIVGAWSVQVPCNAKCTNAKGSSCECSCGGKNHATHALEWYETTSVGDAVAVVAAAPPATVAPRQFDPNAPLTTLEIDVLRIAVRRGGTVDAYRDLWKPMRSAAALLARKKLMRKEVRPLDTLYHLTPEGERVAAANAAPQLNPRRNPAHTFIPPASVSAEARYGLELRASMPPSRRGGTEVGIRRAVQLANRQPVSVDTMKRMRSYFQRHAVDARGRGWAQDSKGWQAWLLWGGDAGRKWCNRVLGE